MGALQSAADDDDDDTMTPCRLIDWFVKCISCRCYCNL